MYRVTGKGASSGYKLIKKYDIKHLSAAPMCLEYIGAHTGADNSYLLWGDTDGICPNSNAIELIYFSSRNFFVQQLVWILTSIILLFQEVYAC